jgi:hypothetical protein
VLCRCERIAIASVANAIDFAVFANAIDFAVFALSQRAGRAGGHSVNRATINA